MPFWDLVSRRPMSERGALGRPTFLGAAYNRKQVCWLATAVA